MIDMIWRALIHHREEYMKFCKDNLGGFLERQDPKESLTHHYFDYRRTLELLNIYNDKLEACKFLWPDLTPDQYLVEYNKTISATRKDIQTHQAQMTDLCKNNLELISKNILMICNEVMKKSGSDTAPARPKCSKDEFKTISLKPITVNNLYNKLVNVHKDTKGALMERIQTKLLLNDNSAEALIIEYYKFLIIKCKRQED